MIKDLEKGQWRGRIYRYAPLILWVGVILLLSSGQGSMSQTSLFIRPLLEFLFPDSAEETLIVYHGYIRKFAHFAEYGVLGFLAARAFATSSIKFLRNQWFIAAFVLVLLVASIDEINQSYIASRTGSIYDVLLDCAGGLTMILLFALYKLRLKNQSISKKIQRN